MSELDLEELERLLARVSESLPWEHDLDSSAPGYRPQGIIESCTGGAICYMAQHANVRTVMALGEEFSHDTCRLIVETINALRGLIAAAQERDTLLEAASQILTRHEQLEGACDCFQQSSEVANAEADKAQCENASLRAEVASLREALRPFAQVGHALIATGATDIQPEVFVPAGGPEPATHVGFTSSAYMHAARALFGDIK